MFVAFVYIALLYDQDATRHCPSLHHAAFKGCLGHKTCFYCYWEMHDGRIMKIFMSITVPWIPCDLLKINFLQSLPHNHIATS